jgi:N-acetylglucosamine-6-phosphate deacetylase
VPRRKTLVKRKQPQKATPTVLARSLGAIDIHFHGAFGIDLMSAQSPELDETAHQLGRLGIAGFCPTTLSVSPDELAVAVERLGRWTKRAKNLPSSSALPLGIHLEGPFINPGCCGAHPPELIRKLDFKELEHLRELSQNTLKIVTLSPESLIEVDLKRLTKWAQTHQINLSIGHSKATEKQAEVAFSSGFRGITHAWNALPFHQRAPGPIAAAFKSAESYIEIIIDQVHVAPSVIRWTESLQPLHRLCYVSDCVPAAETAPGMITSFGPLKILYADGACRLTQGEAMGALAGGGKILTHAFSEWISALSENNVSNLKKLLKARLPCITEAPLFALGLKNGTKAGLRFRTISWLLSPGGLISSSSLK